ncbi:hypothetical protein EV2_026332 [Malus domestica]
MGGVQVCTTAGRVVSENRRRGPRLQAVGRDKVLQTHRFGSRLAAWVLGLGWAIAGCGPGGLRPCMVQRHGFD